jgi:hypothetical protein
LARLGIRPSPGIEGSNNPIIEANNHLKHPKQRLNFGGDLNEWLSIMGWKLAIRRLADFKRLAVFQTAIFPI